MSQGDGVGGEPIERAIAALRRVSGSDFTDFRQTTLERRISRRMGLLNVRSLEEYVRLLEQDEPEARALFHDVLISVTGFFREPEAFETLKRIAFPDLIARGDEDVRIWVPGCSTGEEPYSLAIALVESLEAAGLDRQVQIFATDINDAQIARARLATYTDEAVANVSPERLARFFDRIPSGWRVRKRIREKVVFARHDLTRDPPFTRIDLVSCRNLLIYWNRNQQDRVLPLFHYALRGSGFLLLGTAESASRFPELFERVERTSKLYRRLENDLAPRVFFGPYMGEQRGGREPSAASELFDGVIAEASKLVTTRGARAAVLIDGHLLSLFFWGDVQAFFSPSAGEAGLALSRLASKGLLPNVMAAVEEVRTTGQAAWRGPVPLADSEAPLTLQVVPIQRDEAMYFLVLLGVRRGLVDPAPVGPAGAEWVSVLEDAREQLAEKIEELTAANEELRTAEDQLHGANAELIEAGHEQELRNAQLERANDDLKNILASANLPLVVLDSENRIGVFTPQAATLIGLRAEDVGRPIGDLDFTARNAFIAGLASKVSADGKARTHEFIDGRGRTQVVSVAPYVSAEPGPNGAVLTFIDVESVRRRALQESSRLLSALTAIDRTINSVMEPDEIVRGAVGQAAAAVKADSAAFYSRDEGGWVAGYSIGLGDPVAVAADTDRLPFLDLQRTHELLRVRDIFTDERFEGTPQRAAGNRSLLAVQLAVRDRVIGTLVLGFGRKTNFTAEWLAFVEGLGTALSIALENARLYGAERNVADRLQEALLQLPEHVAGVDFAALYRAASHEARVGGDFFDVFEASEHCVVIVVGDVSGKGLEAASLTALARNAFRAHAVEDCDPALVLTKANRLVHRFTPTATFLTAFIAMLDPATGDLRYCSAGHPPAIIAHPVGAEFLPGSDPILGAFPDIIYTTRTARLESADCLVAYTDGVTEAGPTGAMLGEAGVLASVAGVTRGTPEQILEAVMQDTLTIAAGETRDDIALLAVRRLQPAVEA